MAPHQFVNSVCPQWRVSEQSTDKLHKLINIKVNQVPFFKQIRDIRNRRFLEEQRLLVEIGPRTTEVRTMSSER